MFYKILFLLALFNLFKAGKSFIKENVVVKDGKQAEIPTGAYVSFGMTAMFYVMVLAICFIPSILW